MPLNYSSERAHCQTPPLSPAFQMAPIPFSVSDLSYQMSQYSLQQLENCSNPRTQNESYEPFYYTSPSRPSTPTEPASPASTVSCSSISTPPSSIFATSSASSRINSGYYTANVRQQRQRALRRQCSASHLREISALVSRMVSEGDQCSVGSAASTPVLEARPRHNSDPTSDATCAPLSDYGSADDDMDDSMEEGDSEPETFNDTCEGYKIQENGGLIDWHSPWASKTRCPDGKCGVKKDTRSRKRTRRRLQAPL